MRDYSRVYDFTEEGDVYLSNILGSNDFVLDGRGLVKEVYYKEIKKGGELGQVDLFYGFCRLSVLEIESNPLRKFIEEYKSLSIGKPKRHACK